MSKTTTRVQLELPEPSFARLSSLKARTEAASYSEVIKNALRLYEAMVLEAEKGNEISVRDESGREVIYKPIF